MHRLQSLLCSSRWKAKKTADKQDWRIHYRLGLHYFPTCLSATRLDEAYPLKSPQREILSCVIAFKPSRQTTRALSVPLVHANNCHHHSIQPWSVIQLRGSRPRENTLPLNFRHIRVHSGSKSLSLSLLSYLMTRNI